MPPAFPQLRLIPSVESSPSHHRDAAGGPGCDRLPWEVMGSPSLEISQVSLNVTWRNWPNLGISLALSREVREGAYRGPFQDSLILDSVSQICKSHRGGFFKTSLQLFLPPPSPQPTRSNTKQRILLDHHSFPCCLHPQRPCSQPPNPPILLPQRFKLEGYLPLCPLFLGCPRAARGLQRLFLVQGNAWHRHRKDTVFSTFVLCAFHPRQGSCHASEKLQRTTQGTDENNGSARLRQFKQ